MKKTIIVCDKCGVEVENPHDLNFFKERRSNGTENENWYWHSDLCPRCTSLLATKLIKIVDLGKDSILSVELAREFNCKEI